MAKIAEQAERYDGMLLFFLFLLCVCVCVCACVRVSHRIIITPNHIPESPYFNLRDMSLDLY